MKKYQYKHYNKNGDFVQVIDESIILSEISFSDVINWPQGRLGISLRLNWQDSIFEQGDYIKVFCINDFFKTGYQIYYGYIYDIPKQANTYEQVELEVYPIGSLLERKYYQSGVNYSFTNNNTAKEHIDAIIDYFDTIFPGIITKWDIDNPAWDINKEFDYDYCLSSLRDICSNFEDTHFWYIDRLGRFNFKLKTSGATQLVTFQKDIEELIESGEIDIVNRLHLFYDGANKTYEDAASIAKYGVYEKKISDTSILDLASADIFGNDYIEANKEVINEVQLTLNDSFRSREIAYWDDDDIWDDDDLWIELFENNKFEGIEIWDTIKILNRRGGILWYVHQKRYTRDTMQLKLGKYENVIWLIRNNG